MLKRNNLVFREKEISFLKASLKYLLVLYKSWESINICPKRIDKKYSIKIQNSFPTISLCKFIYNENPYY